MSDIGGIGPQGTPYVAPARSTTGSADAPPNAVDNQALEKLQDVVKQIAGAANTCAIPSHQSW